MPSTDRDREAEDEIRDVPRHVPISSSFARLSQVGLHVNHVDNVALVLCLLDVHASHEIAGTRAIRTRTCPYIMPFQPPQLIGRYANPMECWELTSPKTFQEVAARS